MLVALVGLLLAGCGSPVQSHGGPVEDQVSLIDALRKSVTVEVSGTVSQPFLHAQSGTALRLSGGPLSSPADMQVFEYDSQGAADRDARQIRPDGSGTPTTIVHWVAPPHFFRKGRVIVVYVGNGPAVTTLLNDVLGPQFAGR